MPSFFDPCRPRINGQPTMSGVVLPHISVTPDIDPEQVQLVAFLPVGPNASRHYATRVPLSSLESVFRDYTNDPETTLQRLFLWRPPELGLLNVTLEMLSKNLSD